MQEKATQFGPKLPRAYVPRLQGFAHFFRITKYAAMVRPIKFATTKATRTISIRIDASMLLMCRPAVDLLNSPTGVFGDERFRIRSRSIKRGKGGRIGRVAQGHANVA